VAGEKILVVDDSKQMREFLIQLVQLEGFEVSTAKDGSEGLSYALKDSPALIITDQAMPGLTGPEMMEGLREAGSEIPAILITAEGSEEIASRALRAGVMDYFIKPFDPIELQEAIHRILGATRVGSVRTGVPDQRRLDALNTLISIGKSVTSLLDLEQILFRVTEAAVYLTGAEEGTLMLVDEETGELYVRVSKNLEAGLQSIRLAVRDSLAGQVIRTGTPLLIGEGQQKIKTHYLVHSLLYAPLKVQERVIGVLGVHNRIVDRPLSQADVGIISALADYAAIAIVNAQLYATSETERTKLSRIVQQIQDAVILVDYEGRVALCNYVGHEFLNGVGPEGPVGRWLADVTENGALLDLLDDDPDQLVRHGEVELADGRVFNAQVSEVKGVGRAIVMQDITHLKELNRIKSELLTMASHDLRSPLTAILTYVDLMDRMGGFNDKQRDFGENIKSSVQSITDLIDDLLQLNQIDAGLDKRRELASLDEVVRHTIEALKGQADVKHQLLTVNIARDVPKVFGDSIRLRQMLMNLVSNAIKYTPEGGVVGVSLFEEGGEAVLVVSDTGIGIPVEDQPHIFDKFYRVDKNKSDFQGLGLGLSIVRSIVDLHNGRVWVESQPGEGTTFTVVLPSAKTAARYEPQGEVT
jgi:two-component system phosphate regulon sensor histidine kinase PhoR